MANKKATYAYVAQLNNKYKELQKLQKATMKLCGKAELAMYEAKNARDGYRPKGGTYDFWWEDKKHKNAMKKLKKVVDLRRNEYYKLSNKVRAQTARFRLYSVRIRMEEAVNQLTKKELETVFVSALQIIKSRNG